VSQRLEQMTRQASFGRQSDELLHGPDPNRTDMHALVPSTSVTHPQKSREKQSGFPPQCGEGGVGQPASGPHERQVLPGEQSPYGCANAGVLIVVRIGADQATAVPAPIRFSIRRLEIS
jgi:hypothetical protein